MKRCAEKLREIGAVASHGYVNARHAHSLLDDILALCQGGQTRYADIHIRDIGASHALAKDLEDSGIYTLSDLANCCHTKLPGKLDVLDALGVTLTALRRLLDLEKEMAA